MSDAITQQQLIDAANDALTLGEFANNAADTPNPGHDDGTVTNRTGSTFPSIAKFLADLDDRVSLDAVTAQADRAQAAADDAEATASSIDVSTLAPKASPVFSGNPTAPTPAVNDDGVSIATTAFVIAQIAAVLADGPTLGGDAKATTPSPGDDDTSIATTGFVFDAIKAAIDGTLMIVGASLAVPGYIRFSDGTNKFMLQFGTLAINGNTASAPIAYPRSFATFSIPVGLGARASAGDQSNYPAPIGGSAGTAGFNVSNSSGVLISGYWLAIGDDA